MRPTKRRSKSAPPRLVSDPVMRPEPEPAVEEPTERRGRAPESTPSGRTLSPVRTKQDQRARTAPLTPEERVARNVRANEPTLRRIYQTYYGPGGTRVNHGDELRQQLAELYDILGSGSGVEYTKDPVDLDKFVAFVDSLEGIGDAMDQANKFAHQEAVNEWVSRYREWEEDRIGPPPDMPEPPTRDDMVAALARGQYIHVRNATGRTPTAETLDEVVTERARRVVVNVRTQDAALTVANQLKELYRNPATAPYVRNFKVFLTQTPEHPLKHDKLVVFYHLPEGPDGAPDRVGDAIVDTVANAISEDDLVDEFAPFYARVDKGIAWAEESERFGLAGSFTQSRENMIANVIWSQDQIANTQTFLDLVSQELDNNYVPPLDPHRHQPRPPAQESEPEEFTSEYESEQQDDGEFEQEQDYESTEYSESEDPDLQ
jgi:hypothetical protein